METIIDNRSNLLDTDITDYVQKVKLLIVNSNNEILLAYQRNGYEFPGGTKENNESLNDTLYRELQEETGIVLEKTNLEPFCVSKGYYKDWPEKNRNKQIDIYYYEIKTDELPNLDNINLTESEKQNSFYLKYINLDNILEVIDNNTKIYGDNRGIAKDMKKVLEVYKRIK